MEFYIVVNNQKSGPFSLEELKKQDLSKDTLTWHKGLSSWKKASQISELNGFFDSIPPPIPLKKTKKDNKGLGLIFSIIALFGILALILINLINPMSSGVELTTYSEFKSFLEQKQVSKVEVINKQEAMVYIYKDKLAQPPHYRISKKNDISISYNGPHYQFNIPNNETFYTLLKETEILYKENNLVFEYRFTEEDNFGREFLGWIIFFGVLIIFIGIIITTIYLIRYLIRK